MTEQIKQRQPLIELKDVTKTYHDGKRKDVFAVSNFNLTLYEGETLGLVGESGCGKSTIGNMLVHLFTPDEGSILFRGQDIASMNEREFHPLRKEIQMVFQDPLSSFSPRMKIGTYLAEPRRNYDKVSKQQAFAEAEQLLEKVGLPRDFLVRYPHELSGGQLQRVAIARALAIHPELLICDEATGALDVSIQNQIAKLLVELVREQNMGCIFIGHDLALVRSVTQRIAVMYLGRIVELLDSEDLEVSCRHPYTKALLNSVFDVYCDQNEEIQLLQGEPPSPLQMPEGCPFAPRCPKCTEECRRQIPVLRTIADGHDVACHYAM